VQRSNLGPSPAHAPTAVREVLETHGEPLDANAGRNFESALGHDFSEVRVHAGPRAAEAAETVGARAFTVGSHLVFGSREYRPNTVKGRELIAHELGHVVEQQHGPFRIQRQEAQSPPSTSRAILNMEEAEADLLKMQESVAASTAESPWYMKVLSFFPYFGLDLVRRAVQLGNLLFGISQIQDAADVVADPKATVWQKVRSAIWGLILVALDFMLIGGVAKSVGLKLAGLGTRIGETAAAKFLISAAGELIDGAVDVAREYLPRLMVFIESKAVPMLEAGRAYLAGLLQAARQSSAWQVLSRRLFPEIEAILDRDITPYLQRRLDAVTSTLVGRPGGLGTVVAQDIDRLGAAKGLEQATLTTNAQKEAAGELGTTLVMQLRGWRVVEIPRLPGNQGVDLLFAKDGWFLSAETFAAGEAKGTAGSKVMSLLKRHVINGQVYYQGDELFNMLRLGDRRLIGQVAPAEQPALQALVTEIMTNIGDLQAYFGRVQTASGQVRLFRIDGAVFPNFPEIERMTFGQIKRAYYLLILGETVPQAARVAGPSQQPAP
jgi:hypothetical protein